MLAFWRQKASSLAYRWGVLDYEIEETERPQFQGDYVYDDNTGDVRKVYPSWKRIRKYLFTIPIILMMMIIMLVVSSTVNTTQDRLYKEYSEGVEINYYPEVPSFNLFNTISAKTSTNLLNITIISSNKTDTSEFSFDIFDSNEFYNPDFWFVVFFYPCFYGVLICIVGAIFSSLAVFLNSFENHRTETAFINRLVLKVFN